MKRQGPMPNHECFVRLGVIQAFRPTFALGVREGELIPAGVFSRQAEIKEEGSLLFRCGNDGLHFHQGRVGEEREHPLAAKGAGFKAVWFSIANLEFADFDRDAAL